MSSWATCAWKGWSFQRKVAGENTGSTNDNSNEISDDDDDEHMPPEKIDQIKSDSETSKRKGLSTDKEVNQTAQDADKHSHTDEKPEVSVDDSNMK